MHNFYRTGHNKQVKNFLVMPCLFFIVKKRQGLWRMNYGGNSLLSEIKP